jgi:transposase
MSLESTSREELIALVKLLQQENKELKKRIAQLERKQPPDLPFHPKPSIKQRGKKKRKKRSHGYARILDTPTQVMKHAYSRCPDCSNELHNGWLKRRRQVIDIPLAPATITEHQVFEHWCNRCKKKVAPNLDLSGTVLGNHRVSLKLMSYIATLRNQQRLPLKEIRSHLLTIYHLTLSRGEIIEICHMVAKYGVPLYEHIGQTVQQSFVVNADETGWREDGVNGYLWSFSTPEVHYLTYKKTRAKTVVEEVIGDQFEGVLVSDFYASYNTHLGYHQRCWVHLLRDIKKLCEDYPKDKQVHTWAQQVKAIYQKAKAYTGPDPTEYTNTRTQQQQRWRDEGAFREQLLNMCKPYLTQDVPMKTLCQRIDTFQDELFLFIADPRVPSDNNQAERAIRHSVIARKISGGTRSEKGSCTRFVLASLFGTWKLQGRNAFQECLAMLTASSTGTPFPAIIPQA